VGERRQDRTLSTPVAGRRIRKSIVLNILLLILIAILLYRVYRSFHRVDKTRAQTRFSNRAGGDKKPKDTEGKEAVDAEFKVIEEK